MINEKMTVKDSISFVLNGKPIDPSNTPPEDVKEEVTTDKQPDSDDSKGN